MQANHDAHPSQKSAGGGGHGTVLSRETTPSPKPPEKQKFPKSLLGSGAIPRTGPPQEGTGTVPPLGGCPLCMPRLQVCLQSHLPPLLQAAASVPALEAA